MTTIAVRAGIIASDSQVTYETEASGNRKFRCRKLFRKKTKKHGDVIIATAGQSSPGMLFVDWYGSGRKPPTYLRQSESADFLCLVIRKDGIFEYDNWCREEQIESEFYAIGSGANAALGAMHMGATAAQAVEIAKQIDIFTGGDVVTMSLNDE